jgi:beta-aspartyl-dipeptidase (metallo-type)
MILVIENGEVYAPEPRGRSSVLIVNDRIVHVGTVNRPALDQLQLEYEVIDADGAIVAPGIIDPHQHLLGGSGEEGLSTQTPELFLSEIVASGITTVVGVLGVDTTMKTMAGLLARVKGLREEGLSTCIWSGGYNVPPRTIMGSIREDMLFIDECIGAGEIAISDERALSPSSGDLAKVIFDTHVGGMLASKAGITHIHVGDGASRLQPLRDVLEHHGVRPDWLYPTHVQRTEQLLDEAIAIQQEGMRIDFDTSSRDFVRWYRYFLAHGGNPTRLTIVGQRFGNARVALRGNLYGRRAPSFSTRANSRACDHQCC